MITFNCSLKTYYLYMSLKPACWIKLERMNQWLHFMSNFIEVSKYRRMLSIQILIYQRNVLLDQIKRKIERAKWILKHFVLSLLILVLLFLQNLKSLETQRIVFVQRGSLISSFMSITMKYDNQKVGNRSRSFTCSNELLITNE